MAEDNLKQAAKRELVRAGLERVQSVSIEKFCIPEADRTASYDNVEEHLNIPYMNRDEAPLGMDIFKPIVPKETELPVIVTIHGGGLVMGDRKISRPFARYLASRGYLVFSIEYRLAPRANVCMQLDDVCAGLDLVGAKLVDFDVDFERIFIAAESAGAYLAAYVTAMKKSRPLQEAIDYAPARMTFKAIGMISGMLYTNRNDPIGWILADQIYGEKRVDENFLQYMNPEHPEIIRNLPPAYLITSRGDGLNQYTLMMNEALKRAGRPCHLHYIGDENLRHSFTSLQPLDPRGTEAIDKMLVWFEEQAKIQADASKNEAEALKKAKRFEALRASGRKSNQRISQFIRECASVHPERGCAPALIDCSCTYTYTQMFEQWDRYARVFTALGITEENKARVAVVGTISAEPLFAFYGLNMVGAGVSMFSYPDLLPGGRWKIMLEKEHITDMVVSDIMVTPQMWDELKKAQAEFGLKHIILLHTRMGGPCLGYAEMFYNEFNYHALKRIPGVLFMDDLVGKYADVAIRYAKKSGSHLAVICHTSGTTNGTRKPLPFTDRTVNSMQYHGDGSKNKRTLAPPFDFSSSQNINGFITHSLAEGETIVLTFFGFMHPKFVYAYKYYGVDFSFTSGFMLDKWMQMPDLAEDAFASLKWLGMGGSYVPQAKLEKYEEFLRAHGFTGVLIQGYGMSELGNHGLIVPKGCSEDILGYPTNAEQFRILDEADGKFYKTNQGLRTGTLYGCADSMCENTLDGVTLFELTEIDGKKFFCTNDLVQVNADGSLSYAGRSGKFFTNSEGVRFEAGIAEKLLAANENIATCVFVPILDKRIHDTVPVLYAIPAHKGPNAAEEVRKAIEDVFLNSGKLGDSVLPSQFILVDSIPCNTNGKVDVYHITRSRLEGTAYNIVPVKTGNKLTGIRTEPAGQLNSYTAGTLPEGMGKDSAYGLFDIFNVPEEITQFKKAQKIWADRMKEFQKNRLGLQGFKPQFPQMETDSSGLPGIPDSMIGPMTALSILLMNQNVTNRDYEE